MGKTTRIIRKSIFTFLQNYQYFTSTPAFLAFPFAISTLLSQSFITSSYLFPLVHGRLKSLFLAAGFPPTSELFGVLNLKLSQTILTFLFVSPFTLSFLLLAKASTIKAALEYNNKPLKENPFSNWKLLFSPLLITQLCNSLVLLSTNATCFCLLVMLFNCFDFLGFSSSSSRLPLLLLSAIGAIIYSIVLANAYIMCNFALILSGIEKNGGFISILKACVVIQGRIGNALSLAVPINMALAGVEALFQYRVVRAYNRDTVIDSSMVLEGMLIGYLYAMLLVLDTIVGFVFLKSCERGYRMYREGMYSHTINIEEIDGRNFRKVKVLELLP